MFTEEERAKWRELVARWKAGEKVFDAGKRIEKTDATTVQRQDPVQPIKRWRGKVIDPKLVERKQQQQPIIKQGKNYTQRRIEEETKRTWLSDAADIAHGAGEGAMFASNFIPFAGELFAGGRAILNNAKSYLLHPFYKTAYHGSPHPFDIKRAWTGTPSDMGLHVSASPSIANSMKGEGGVVYKLRIPRENGEIIDLGRNGAEHFDRSRIYRAMPYDEFYSNGYYDTTPGDEYRISLLERAGANPKVEGNRLFTERDATINVFDSEFPNMPAYMKPRAYAISHLTKGNKNEYGQVLDLNYAKELNKQAADILSKSGYKVLKYNNANPFEGGGGLSYMITDPSVIDVMQNVPKGFYAPFIGSFGGYGINKGFQSLREQNGKLRTAKDNTYATRLQFY